MNQFCQMIYCNLQSTFYEIDFACFVNSLLTIAARFTIRAEISNNVKGPLGPTILVQYPEEPKFNKADLLIKYTNK